MKGKRNRGMLILAAASAAATVGIVWLVIQSATVMPQWALAAAGSPLALRCLVLIVVGVLALGLIAAVLLRARGARAGMPRGFHADQGGTAAIEMALVFPLALMIFLVITQSAILFNANMVVHYSAFTAARMAVVAVPMNINDDPTYPEIRNWVRNPEVESVSDSVKLEMIRRAAVLALVPVSASMKASADSGDQTGSDVLTDTQQVFRVQGAAYQAWFRRVKDQYDYANEYTKIVLDPPHHWTSGNRDGDCPYAHGYTTWVQAPEGYFRQQTVTYCPTVDDQGIADARMDYDMYEPLKVSVTYQFLLEVPYASRFLGDQVQMPDRPTGTNYATEIHAVVTLSNEGGPDIRPKDWVQP
jgi:hypothetical protein